MTTVKVKLLSGASVELEVAPEATVRDLAFIPMQSRTIRANLYSQLSFHLNQILDVKKMIEEKQGEGHAVAAQKLIRSGTKLQSHNVTKTSIIFDVFSHAFTLYIPFF